MCHYVVLKRDKLLPGVCTIIMICVCCANESLGTNIDSLILRCDDSSVRVVSTVTCAVLKMLASVRQWLVMVMTLKEDAVWSDTKTRRLSSLVGMS